MSVIKYTPRPIERVEEFKPIQNKIRQKLVLKESGAKSITTLIPATISILRKDHKNSMNEKIYSANDLILMLSMLQEKNKEFNSVQIDSWHGKSSFEMEEDAEMIYVTKYQKKAKGEEPQEVKYEIDKQELLKLEQTIKHSLKKGQTIGSRELGEIFYEGDWDTKIFPVRKRHNYFTIMLNVLDKQNKIIYKGGKTTLQ